jgi:hypothetical protein
MSVIPIYSGGDRSVVTNYRPVSLTSVVCQQKEHVIAGYLRQVWDTSEWLYEEQHGFRPGYSCRSQTVCLLCDQPDNQAQILYSLHFSDITWNLRIVTISLAVSLGGNPTAVNKISYRTKHHTHTHTHTQYHTCTSSLRVFMAYRCIKCHQTKGWRTFIARKPY